LSPEQNLIPELVAFEPALIIFDKDGTLIDIDAMWGSWVIELARRLETVAGLPVSGQLFEALAFEPDSGAIYPDGPLSIAPAAEQRRLAGEVLQAAGLSADEVETALDRAWHMPDPVATARPLADLHWLFTTLRSFGLKIAVATSDDRTPTQATLAGLGVAALVDALACADDGLPLKPAPAMVLSICDRLDISPAKTVVVGDNVDDLRMGWAAGVGLVIGVLSGVSPASVLAPYADILLPSVENLTI
jgi:phosphoglycolate phosphatase